MSQAQLKKQKKSLEVEKRKLAKKSEQDEAKAKQEALDAERHAKNLEESKKIKIEPDPTLPDAKEAKIRDLEMFREKRVKVYAWVHSLRRQGKKN